MNNIEATWNGATFQQRLRMLTNCVCDQKMMANRLWKNLPKNIQQYLKKEIV